MLMAIPWKPAVDPSVGVEDDYSSYGHHIRGQDNLGVLKAQLYGFEQRFIIYTFECFTEGRDSQEWTAQRH